MFYNILWQIKTTAGSLGCKVLFWISCLYPLFVLHIKKDWRLKNWFFFFKNLRNITTPAFCKTFPARLLGEGLLVSSVKMNTKISFLHKLRVTLQSQLHVNHKNGITAKAFKPGSFQGPTSSEHHQFSIPNSSGDEIQSPNKRPSTNIHKAAKQ